MARVSRVIQISDKDREHLEDMLRYTDQRTAERIRIVLACSEESSNKAVATMLHTDEHKVAKWKAAYLDKGIDGLKSSAGSGRKPKTRIPELEEKVLHLLQDENQDWTIRRLSQELGTTDYQVSKILRDRDITLGRNRKWTYETTDSISSSDIEVIGLYISSHICAVLMAYHPYGIRTLPGVFTTKNKTLAEKLENAGYKLSVCDLLSETTYYPGSYNLDKSFQTVIQKWMKIISIDDSFDSLHENELSYQLFIWSQDPFTVNGVLPPRMKLSVFESYEELFKALQSWSGARTFADQLYEIQFLIQSMKKYLAQNSYNPELFLWEKAIESVGSKDHPAPFLPWKETKPQIGMEEWVEQLLHGEIKEADIQSGLIAFTKSSNGVTYRLISNNSEMPAASEFAFDSEEGFLNGMNQLERAILKLRDEAGIAVTDQYLEQVKKNKTRLGS